MARVSVVFLPSVDCNNLIYLLYYFITEHKIIHSFTQVLLIIWTCYFHTKGQQHSTIDLHTLTSSPKKKEATESTSGKAATLKLPLLIFAVRRSLYFVSRFYQTLGGSLVILDSVSIDNEYDYENEILPLT